MIVIVSIILTAHLSSDWPRFLGSQPHVASGFHSGQCRSEHRVCEWSGMAGDKAGMGDWASLSRALEGRD